MPDEKFDEKEAEKREEKSPEEKSWDEKWRRDPLNAIVWAVIFIWAGLVLLAVNLGFLNFVGAAIPGFSFFGAGAWGLIFLGAGVIILIEVALRLTMPAYRRPITGSLILAVIFIGIGLGNLFGWNVIWPLILIALGASVLLRGILRER